ncbi:chromate transporter [Alkalicoccus halolimnae]|uniref:Chromate transporter n=1 Tax=Alkalicoccus halolimnae TaxID=1667239 RepID=A0A5C7FGV0_9BACI|nr:chromate transporter [Alkalicoccus halolimnae]TXF85504.1 chromate transporter [Alkalicoccus halolimnae]
MAWHTNKQIFLGFFRAGMLGYGGGPASIPLVHKEVVGKYKWMDDDEFSDILAIGNTLPGPIITKMAGYIGYRVNGSSGLLTAIIASVIPTVLLMLLLLGFLHTFIDEGIMQGMTAAVAPVVGVLMSVLAYSFFKQSQKGMGWNRTLFLGLVSVVVYIIIGAHPALLIGILIIYALVIHPMMKKGGRHA